MGRERPLRLPLEPLRGCRGRAVEVVVVEDDVDSGETPPVEPGDGWSGRLRGQSPNGGGAESSPCGRWTVGRLDLSVAG